GRALGLLQSGRSYEYAVHRCDLLAGCSITQIANNANLNTQLGLNTGAAHQRVATFKKLR
ncbi:MAG TPA: hypothetical protein DEV93_20275, partial [Chloroflexi bacterium]|nr:hypothetical protein [Chloroflexota bacterium]